MKPVKNADMIIGLKGLIYMPLVRNHIGTLNACFLDIC